jgi:ribonuclease-3
MLRRSRRSARQSTTSQPTSKRLAELIAKLPPERLATTFTHPSWVSARGDSYERLEFLGDSVLELAIARQLYDRFPDFDEGQLAKLRSQVVSRASCALIALELGLGERLAARRPQSDELTRLADNRNVLAALLEAALASTYLEYGFEAVEGAIVDAFADRIDYALTHRIDFKTELQEELARRGLGVSYVLLDSDGAPHERTFTAAAVIGGNEAGVGKGSSKKSAEQEAARVALAFLDLQNSDVAPSDAS